MSITEQLKQAIGTGELLTIIYNGGSQPGSKRMISPVKISPDEKKVRARCYTSNAVKEFVIDKIVIVDNPEGETDYQKNVILPEPKNLTEGVAQYLEELNSLGWHVELEDDSIGLFTTLKNGKLRKTAVIKAMYYQSPNKYDDTNHREWTLYSGKEKADSFKYLSSLIVKLILAARNLAPIKNKE